VLFGGGYVPKKFTKVEVQKALTDDTLWREDQDVVDRLWQNGILTKEEIGGTVYLSFNLDPLAEYLGALYHVDRLKDDEEAWKEWLDHLRNVPGYADGIHGFLVALDQCIATYKESLGIPDVELWRKGLEAAA